MPRPDTERPRYPLYETRANAVEVTVLSITNGFRDC